MHFCIQHLTISSRLFLFVSNRHRIPQITRPLAVSLVVAADLVTTLSGTGPFTVIAPTNDAFAKLPPAVVAALQLPANKALLAKVLTYHVIAGTVKSTDLKDRTSPTTVQGDALDVFVQYGTNAPYFNFAGVVTADNLATNGVVHIIDHVVLPLGVSAMLGLEEVPAAAEASSQVVPVATAAKTAVSTPFNGTIVEYLVSNAQLSTLVTAASAAKLVDTLSGAGPFTVFAPVNAAFAALNQTIVAQLLQPANIATLQQVLLYHVVGSAVQSTSLTDRLAITTLCKQNDASTNCPPATAYVTTLGSVYVDFAEVTTRDVVCTNGVVHVVDAVIVPVFGASPTPTPTPTTAPAKSGLSVGAIVGISLGGIVAIAAAFFLYSKKMERRMTVDDTAYQNLTSNPL
jgi:transforming growth factor-beta-induced protein